MQTRPRLLVLLAAIVLVTTTACSQAAPDPGASDTPSAPTSSATPSASVEPADATIELPETCEDAFSVALRDRLAAEQLPLNDLTLTMPSTDVTAGQELLETVPHLRCSWSVASEVGIATEIALIDAAQATALQTALAADGLTCASVEGDDQQTRCTREESFEGEMAGKIGEIHVFKGNAWISTKWINVGMAGYADDMVATLWA